MSDNIEKFCPANAADNADNVLEQAVGQFSEVLVIGWDTGGDLDIRCTSGLVDGGEMLWLIERFKSNLMNGEYNAETNP